MERYNCGEDKAVRLLERYKAHEPLDSTELELIKLFSHKGKLLLPYLDGGMRKLVSHICDPLNSKVIANYKVVVKDSVIINLSEMAQVEGYTVQHLSALMKENGYTIKYDRNRRYDPFKVITYVEVR